MNEWMVLVWGSGRTERQFVALGTLDMHRSMDDGVFRTILNLPEFVVVERVNTLPRDNVRYYIFVTL